MSELLAGACIIPLVIILILSMYLLTFVCKSMVVKAITYYERPKMKWGTREKSSLFIRKKTAFFSGTPLHFRPFVVRYGFRCGDFLQANRPKRGPVILQLLHLYSE